MEPADDQRPTAREAPGDELGAASEPVPVDLRDYVDFAPDAPAGRRVFATDVLALDLVCLEPGQHVGARAFEEADVVYTVLGGRAWVVTPETEVILEPLQALLMPAGVTHGIRNDSADPLIMQAAASPPDALPPVHEGPARRPVRRGRRQPGTLDRLRRALGGPG